MIEKIDRGIYKTIHNNMKESEEYKKILFLICYFMTKPEDFYLNEEILGKKLDIERRVIQKTKAYLNSSKIELNKKGEVDEQKVDICNSDYH